MRLKRLMCFVLVFLCLVLCKTDVCFADNEPDPREIEEQILSLETEYPSGMPWTNSIGYIWVFRGSVVNMSGCAAFTAILQDAVFGSIDKVAVTWQAITRDCPVRGMKKNDTPYAWETLFPGDILEYKGHSVIVVQKYRDYVIIAEGNYAGTVKWGRMIFRDGVEKAKYVLTRYKKSDSYLQVSRDNVAQWAKNTLIWCADQNIIGINPYVDDSNVNCTRAEAVYALWRAVGAPVVEENCPFTDVPDAAPYRDAVIWAANTGVTAGTSKTTFSPDSACTRAQSLTFIHRFFASPTPSGFGQVFRDVPQSAYYANAVLWAYEHGITTGTGRNHFSPEKEVKRCEFLTFLYRCFG